MSVNAAKPIPADTVRPAEAKALRDAATTPEAQRWGNRAYAALALGLVFYVVAIWVEAFIDTRKLSPRVDLFSESHRHWRLRTALVFLVWSVVGGLTLPFGVGWLVLIPAWLWYVWRVARGLVAFRSGHPIGAAFVRPRARVTPTNPP